MNLISVLIDLLKLSVSKVDIEWIMKGITLQKGWNCICRSGGDPFGHRRMSSKRGKG